MRFAVDGDRIELPSAHPLMVDGVYPTIQLIEAAAQLAGRSVQAEPGHAGMLVEVEGCTLHRATVAPGAIHGAATVDRQMGPLWRLKVRLWDEAGPILETGLTLRIG